MCETEIAHAQEVWEEEVLRHCSGLFDGHWLPSHDIGHHQRVWKNACLLAPYFKPDGEGGALESFFEQLLIACYFHDLGLLREKGPRHGRESRLICEFFLNLHSDKIRFNITDLLEAIEHHDDKDYNLVRDTSHSILYQILTLADDLDAFGAMGCYRYIEIYLMRGLKSNEIPDLIIENAENRYRNFVEIINDTSFPLQLIDKKYSVLTGLLSSGIYSSSPEGLVEWIEKHIVQTRVNPMKFLSNIEWELITDKRIKEFISEFLSEQR